MTTNPQFIHIAAFIPTRQQWSIVFVDFDHNLSLVPSVEECAPKARQILLMHYLRCMVDGILYPAAAERDAAEYMTLSHINQHSIKLDGDVILRAIGLAVETVTSIEAHVTELKKLYPGEQLPITPEIWKLITNKEKEKSIQFIDVEYNELFRVPDGGFIRINGYKRQVKYIDETHFKIVGGVSYHICEFAERNKANGTKVEPFPQDEPTE